MLFVKYVQQQQQQQQFRRNYQPDVRQQHGSWDCQPVSAVLIITIIIATENYVQCPHWSDWTTEILVMENYVLLLKIELGNTLYDCCSREQSHWQQKWGTNVKCVSISHYIKLNYWNPDVNVNKACCRHTTDIKKDRSYTSSRINIQHNEANLSKCYLAFQP